MSVTNTIARYWGSKENMKARSYQKSDKEQLDSFYHSRNMPTLPESFLPKHGAIVDGLAAGFLYLSEGNLAFIEGLISMDHVPTMDRSRALDLVTEMLLEDAKRLNVKKVMAYTESQAVLNRAISFGFNYIGEFQILSKDFE